MEEGRKKGNPEHPGSILWGEWERGNMTAALDDVFILAMLSALGAFLFLASTVIFLVEETAKYLIHIVGESGVHLQEWLRPQEKVAARVHSKYDNSKP